jgi:endoplasmic reticulum-Golgi intermediate compartment protein 2
MITETVRWFNGTTHHTFSVEKGVSHDLQINLDVVVKMQCVDIRVNVQDAAGDRILAGDKLKKDPTSWDQWGKNRNVHKLGSGYDDTPRWEDEDDVHDYLGAAKRKRKFAKTPKPRWPADSCRIYGNLDLNKVQADFHITARGHGYMEFGEHLDHNSKRTACLLIM